MIKNDVRNRVMAEKKPYDKILRFFQVLASLFMLAMLIGTVALMIKYDIKPSNAEQIAMYLTGGTLTVALFIIVFTVVKSFTLVFPPSLLFTVSGIFFEDYLTAITVNFIASSLSLFIPYFLGRFTGKSMVESLAKRFPKIKKIDDFAGANEFAIIFFIKASGLLPTDLSSVIFGAMNMNFGKYIVAANLGLLPLNLLWALVGNKGDVSNPLSLLYVLPIPVFTVVAGFILKKVADKQKKQAEKEET